MGGAILEMRGIAKAFSSVYALKNVDFTLEQGRVMALVGENGAGKSTRTKASNAAVWWIGPP